MGDLHGYSNWIVMELQYLGTEELKITDAELKHGKFYYPPSKDKDMSISQLHGLRLKSGDKLEIGSCGHDSAAAGTNGTFYIKTTGGTKICKVFWTVPYSAVYKCYFTVSEKNDKFVVDDKLVDKEELGNGGPNAYIGRTSIRIASWGN